MNTNATNPYTFEGQMIVRKTIKKYLGKHGMTSTRKVAAFVYQETGMNISASTVSRLVRKFGWDRQKVEWETLKEGEAWVEKMERERNLTQRATDEFEACPKCHHPNKSGFAKCSWCKEPRR